MTIKSSKHFVVITLRWADRYSRTSHFILESLGNPSQKELYEAAYKEAVESTNKEIREELTTSQIPLIEGGNWGAETTFYYIAEEKK